MELKKNVMGRQRKQNSSLSTSLLKRQNIKRFINEVQNKKQPGPSLRLNRQTDDSR